METEVRSVICLARARGAATHRVGRLLIRCVRLAVAGLMELGELRGGGGGNWDERTTESTCCRVLDTLGRRAASLASPPVNTHTHTHTQTQIQFESLNWISIGRIDTD
jgi:hypothetical protein